MGCGLEKLGSGRPSESGLPVFSDGMVWCFGLYILNRPSFIGDRRQGVCFLRTYVLKYAEAFFGQKINQLEDGQADEGVGVGTVYTFQ